MMFFQSSRSRNALSVILALLMSAGLSFAAPKGPTLKERIAATDRLIDRIVYRLYGLTEEEIAVVEGTADRQ